MTELESFRNETREWLEANCPESMRTPVSSFEDIYNGGRKPEVAHTDQPLWCERMAERGWTVPHWPKEYGGGGLNNEQVKVLNEEMEKTCHSAVSAHRCQSINTNTQGNGP
ncbi:MAG: acyl-CoA dehydrogenase family protein [Pseudomonadota bacterium]